MNTRLLCLFALAALSALAARPHTALPEEPPVVLPLRERAQIRDRWTAERLETIVPELLDREGFDMWILVAREYNEDPVVSTMLPATWLSARRRTMLLLTRTDDGLERLAVSRYAVGDLFEAAWDPEQQPDQWARLAELVAERDPQQIGIDVSSAWAHADGLSHHEHEALVEALTPDYVDRLASAERLAVGWLETRTPDEVTAYEHLCRIAHDLIAEGLSTRVIQPGVTTTDDVSWWFRERIAERRLTTWFHPDVSLQRGATPGHDGSFAAEDADTVILPGDLLHVDIGIRYLGLNTDTQQHAYVLLPGQTDAPGSLKRGLAAGNRLQDLLAAQFIAGRTGNQALAGAREAALAEGLRPTIYTHPLGVHGHGAGATIGLWDHQEGVPGSGDYGIQPDTVWSIELSVAHDVPEWGDQTIRVMLEEDAVFDGARLRFLDGRQEQLLLVR